MRHHAIKVAVLHVGRDIEVAHRDGKVFDFIHDAGLKAAAPYFAPRLAAQAVQVGTNVRDLSDEELADGLDSALKELLESGGLATMLARLGWRVEPLGSRRSDAPNG